MKPKCLLCHKRPMSDFNEVYKSYCFTCEVTVRWMEVMIVTAEINCKNKKVPMRLVLELE